MGTSARSLPCFAQPVAVGVTQRLRRGAAVCGFVGLIGVKPAAPTLVLGLQAIQHRGQDAAGVGTLDNGRFHLARGLGLITNALPRTVIEQLHGTAGIAHVRYPTSGTSATREDAQPFLTRHPGLMLAHNGNITNVPELTASLRSKGMQVYSQCDAEPLMLVLAQELTQRRQANHTIEDVVAAVGGVLKRVRGGYTTAVLLEVDGQETLVAFRDAHGIRPGLFGEREDGAWMVASESVALDVLAFKKVGDMPPGSVMFFRPGQEPILRTVVSAEPRHCVFERIYFARPDSLMEDGRVNRMRWRMGRRLAEEIQEKGIEADRVIAIPDTSRPAAMAMAEALSIPNREGFIKNRYSGRTFIMPDQQTRKAALRLKLNPIREMFEGQRVLLVDDSIVRGSTMGRIVEMLRTYQPKAIHLAIFSPPVKHPCFYGIDMPSEQELVAAGHTHASIESKLAEQFNVDSVTYLSEEGLRLAAGNAICSACFDGDYVVPVSEAEREAIYGERRT